MNTERSFYLEPAFATTRKQAKEQQRDPQVSKIDRKPQPRLQPIVEIPTRLPPQSKEPHARIEEVPEDDLAGEAPSSISIAPRDNANPNANLEIVSRNFFRSQFRRIVLAADQQVIKEVFDTMMNSTVTLTIRQLSVASREIRKKNKELITGKREQQNEFEQQYTALYSLDPRSGSSILSRSKIEPIAPPNVRLIIIDISLDDKIQVQGLLDSGATFIALSRRIWQSLGSPTLTSQSISIETTDENVSRSLDLIPRLRLEIQGFSILVQAQVVQSPPFELLLGRPFFTHTKAQVVEEEDHEQTLYLTHTATDETIAIPTQERILEAALVASHQDSNSNTRSASRSKSILMTKLHSSKLISIAFDRHSIEIISRYDPEGPDINIIPLPTSQYEVFYMLEIYDNESLVPRKYFSHISKYQTETETTYKYKKVADRVKPIPTTLLEDYRIIRRAHLDPLKNIPVLLTHPPTFFLDSRFTQERRNTLDIDSIEFLIDDEQNLVLWLIREQELAFAWDETEKGAFNYEYFASILILTIEHVSWVLKNISIPLKIFDQVIKIIKDKISSKVYESFNSSYRSR